MTWPPGQLHRYVLPQFSVLYPRRPLCCGWLTLTSDTCEQSGAALQGCSDSVLQGSRWSRTTEPGHYEAGIPKSIWNYAVPARFFLHNNGKNWRVWARGDSDLERLPFLNSLSAYRKQEMNFLKTCDGKIMTDQADCTVALLAIASIILVTLNSYHRCL